MYEGPRVAENVAVTETCEFVDESMPAHFVFLSRDAGDDARIAVWVSSRVDVEVLAALHYEVGLAVSDAVDGLGRRDDVQDADA